MRSRRPKAGLRFGEGQCAPSHQKRIFWATRAQKIRQEAEEIARSRDSPLSQFGRKLRPPPICRRTAGWHPKHRSDRPIRWWPGYTCSKQSSDVKSSRPKWPRGQDFGLGLGLEGLASASKFGPQSGLNLVVLLCNRVFFVQKSCKIREFG